MTELEKAVEALKLCVPPELYEKAIAKVEKTTGGAKSARRRDKREASEVITRMLLDLGLSQHLKGWTFASTAIALILEDFTLLDGITKRLYPEVARIHGTTSGRVERGIRHAIEEAWKNGDPEVQYACFRNTLNAEKAKPTNSQFLARVAHAARAELEQ